ncbi:DUF1366 domain-containing protein [Streptococcus iniae]|uniref:DUF1366 domain-containing protein n=1 Tax=Streptococcus iniae TaxID=1346 RepID=UPI00273F591C|nr:DUF1366 domain-containing protein [Streptococcus iniae]WLR88597.1 DUF1366 domain-containing protein [Streptococcus iniae]
MLNITSKYPKQMADGSLSGTSVIIDGTDEHAGWHIPLELPKEYLNTPQDEVMKLCQELIFQKLDPAKALSEKFNQFNELVEKADKVATTGNLAAMKLIEILYSKGTITDEDIVALN